MIRTLIMLARRLTSAPRATFERQARRRAQARFELLESRTVLSSYKLPLVNNTLLNPADYTIYVDGAAAGMTLQPSGKPGVLTFQQQTGTEKSYKVGVGPHQYNQIKLPAATAVNGGLLYFFAVPRGGARPSFPYGVQPTQSYPYEFAIVELSKAANGAPTVDASAVDGFTFPMTVSLNGGQEVGQPLSSQSPNMNRLNILTAYQNWMAEHAAEGGAAYAPLELPLAANADNQSAGILNPYSYLTELHNGAVPVNAASPLNNVFDSALQALFGSTGWSVTQLTPTGPKTSSYETYTESTFTNLPYPGTTVPLSGIQFTNGADTYRVFDPRGVNEYLTAGGQPLTLTPVPNSNNTEFVLNGPPPASEPLTAGMYVYGAGFATSTLQHVQATSEQIQGVSQNAHGQTVIALNQSQPLQGASEQVVISKLPYVGIMQDSSSTMVFGGAGFFADANIQYDLPPGATPTTAAIILAGIENQIDEALNRGVALPGIQQGGGVTNYWGTETNWYPLGQPRNLYAEFMHTAKVGSQLIFVPPSHPAKDAQGNAMGQAYGFSYDETPGVPANQPNVPAKFDPVPAGTKTITITLDPWVSQTPTPTPTPTPAPTPTPTPPSPTPDPAAPQVVSVQRFGYHKRPTSLVIHFNEPLAPASADDPANYHLVYARSGRTISLTAANYNAATDSVTLEPVVLLPLRHRYRLTVVGTPPDGVRGADGQFLDGSGASGTGFATIITRRNLVFDPR